MGESNSIENHFDGRAGGDVQQIAINAGTVVSGGDRQPVGHKFSPLDQPFYNQTEPVRQLGELIESRDPNLVRVLVVSGLIEVGKTAVAMRAIDRYWDLPVIVIHLDGYRDDAEDGDVLREVLIADGVAPQLISPKHQTQRDMFTKRTSGGPVAVLVDGARSAAEAEQFRPGAAGSVVVVTSWTTRLDGYSVAEDHVVRIEPLSREHAVEMLVGRCRRLSDESPDVVAALAKACGDHPGMLRRVADRLRVCRSEDVAEYIDRILRAPDELDFLRPFYESLSEADRARYRSLGMVGVPYFTAETLALLWNRELGAAWGEIRRFIEWDVIADDGMGRLRADRLVHRHAAHEWHIRTSDEEKREAVRSLADGYLPTAHAADVAVLTEDRLRVATRGRMHPCDRFRGGGGEQRALDWLAANRILLQWLVDEAAAHGLPRQAWQLVEALTALYVNQGHVDDWIKYTLIGVQAAHADGDLAAVARLSSFGTRPLVQRGRFEEARSALAEALRLAREDGDLRLCASVHERIGRYRAVVVGAIAAGTVVPDDEIDGSAIAAYLRAEELFTAARDRRGGLIVRMYRGQSLGEDGSPDALPTLRAALSGFEDTGESRMVGRCWASIGVVQRGLGDVEASATSLLEAVAILSTGGYSVYEYEARAELATTAELAGDADLARDNSRRRHELEIELGLAVPVR